MIRDCTIYSEYFHVSADNLIVISMIYSIIKDNKIDFA